MKVKMITLDAGPNGVKEPGKTYNVDAKEAKELIDGGYAEAISVTKEEPREESREEPKGKQTVKNKTLKRNQVNNYVRT